MPKIFNTSWLAVILATLAFFALGAVWYGFLFSDAWAVATGITAERAEALMAEMGMAAWLLWALLITFGQAIGLLMVIHLASATRMGTCLKYAAMLVITIVGPVLAYACVYQGYSLNGFLIDFGHMLIGYLIMAAIYAAFRGRETN
ncbi:MAG: DUF1761 domain-containing protein [Litorimonas sp.]